MIILQIFRKFLNNKALVRMTFIVFFIAASIILFFAFNKYHLKILNSIGEIDEKDVNFWKVVSSNIKLILKIYLFGVLTVCAYAIFSFLYNTISVGVIAGNLLDSGYNKLALKMIPHGFFEFIGISIAVATVIWAWCYTIKTAPAVIKQKEPIGNVLRKVIWTIIASFVINIVIFIFAGIIETIVSYYKVL
ncbi:Stage II sporulation protein M [Eubacterium ruminantium]|nr:Stage II sporulation protein M [Eubacterium ruminantium]